MHLSDITWLSPDEATLRSRRTQWLVELFYALSLWSSKMAVLGLYWRLFSAFNSARYCIIVLTIGSSLWIMLRVSRFLVKAGSGPV